MTREVLTPDSPRWDDFCKRLDAAIGEHGCAGTNKDNAEAVMRDMGGIDIAASLAYFEDHGGYCDCEILMNVMAPLTNEEIEELKQMDRPADETSNEEIIALARRVASIIEKDRPDEIMQLSMEYGQAMTVAMTIAPLFMGRKGMIGATHSLAGRATQVAELLGIRQRVETPQSTGSGPAIEQTEGIPFPHLKLFRPHLDENRNQIKWIIF